MMSSPAMRQEDRRRPGRDAQTGREFILVLGLEVAWIDQDRRNRAGN